MEDVIHAFASFRAIFLIANITVDEREARPLFWSDEALNFIQIASVASREVVQADYVLI